MIDSCQFESHSVEKLAFSPLAQDSHTVFAVGGASQVSLRSFNAKRQIETDELDESRLLATCSLSSPLTDVCFLPYEPHNFLLASTEAGSLHLLQANGDATELVERSQWNIHKGAVSAIACESHTDVVATAGDDGMIQLRHVESDKALTVFDSDCVAVHTLAFASRDTVVSGNAVGQLNFWDARVSCSEPSKTMLEGTNGIEIWSLAQHPDKPSTFITGSSDGCVTTFDSRMEKWPIARNRAHAGAVWQVSFTPGERVASVGDDGNCLIWKLNDNESANVHQLLAHESPLLTVSAHNNLNALICGAASGALLFVVDFLKL